MSGRPPEEACADVAASNYRGGQVATLMWAREQINAALAVPSKYRDDSALRSLLVAIDDRMRAVQP